MKRAVLLTGATGFVGMEVLARYLERSRRRIIAPIRADDDAAEWMIWETRVAISLRRPGGNPRPGLTRSAGTASTRRS